MKIRVQRYLESSTEWINVSEPLTLEAANERMGVLENQYPENVYRLS